MDQYTLMIVEDEVGIRELTVKYLLHRGYHVVSAKNGVEALKLLPKVKPDLILLDIEMPEMDGFTFCKEVRKKHTIPIIFLTVRRNTIDKVKSFELGGDDYVTKPFNFKELEARIKANIRRYHVRPEGSMNILKHGDLEIHLHNYECYLHGEKIALSTKEMELLVLLANHPNQVWSQEQIYNQIWSLDASGNVDTVKVHISHLRRKLEKDHRNPQLIKTVRGFGYMFVS